MRVYPLYFHVGDIVQGRSGEHYRITGVYPRDEYYFYEAVSVIDTYNYGLKPNTADETFFWFAP